MALSVSVIVCEKVLQGGIPSAIQISSVFEVKLIPDVAIEVQPARIAVLVIAREVSREPRDWCQLQLQLTRPSGQIVKVGVPLKVELEEVIQGVPRGFNATINFGVIPREQGTHYVSVLMDEVEVARTPVTILTSDLTPKQTQVLSDRE